MFRFCGSDQGFPSARGFRPFYTEREPLALIKYLESYLVMDQYGYFLELTKEKKFEDLPIIYNIQFIYLLYNIFLEKSIK